MPTMPDLSTIAESIVISWVQGEVTPPRSLRSIVGQWKNITLYLESKDDVKAEQIANSLYERLEVAALPIAQEHIRVEAQIRHAQRKAEARMTWMQKCNRAIAQYNQGVQV